ncbi:hypothetical protein K2173_025037 [Erythroxylum novogranatense]|uniref:Uncharacterized protein n=1 Tax=Erythroxylum novogranatense TaxID=1862640 RepID=A0AAV8UGQ2_9ROSI|nr:hypothetical protein K2173_025037 [Erythroxylum novogranatense]
MSSKRIVPDNMDKPDWPIDVSFFNEFDGMLDNILNSRIPKIEPNSDLRHVVEIKTQDQIKRMRETCRIRVRLYAREVLDAAAQFIRPGLTTDEIDRVVHEATITAGVWRDRMWPDGWTAVTADGKRSVQFEHTLLDQLVSSYSIDGQWTNNVVV